MVFRSSLPFWGEAIGRAMQWRGVAYVAQHLPPPGLASSLVFQGLMRVPDPVMEMGCFSEPLVLMVDGDVQLLVGNGCCAAPTASAAPCSPGSRRPRRMRPDPPQRS
jgi:hypothetical protein